MAVAVIAGESHAGEADTARKLYWDRVTEAARFERGRSCGFIATLSRFARNSRACLATDLLRGPVLFFSGVL